MIRPISELPLVVMSWSRVNENIYKVFADFKRAAKKSGWSEEETDWAINSAKTSDYGGAILSLNQHVVEPYEL